MTRIIVCSAALFAIVSGLGYGLRTLSTTIDFWPFMGVCAALCATTLALAFGYDHYEAKNNPPSNPTS